MRDGVLMVRLHAPPIDGEANLELIRLLARALRVPQREIQILNGHNCRNKTLAISANEVNIATLEKLGIANREEPE
jgi:uncharacterized protein YggU (UPF0235/DUF167 family)